LPIHGERDLFFPSDHEVFRFLKVHVVHVRGLQCSETVVGAKHDGLGFAVRCLAVVVLLDFGVRNVERATRQQLVVVVLRIVVPR
jgi:hypothetical protein